MYTHQGPRLYLAADQRTVVPEGDLRAAFLLIAPGQTMSDADAERYGLASAPEQPEQPEQPEKAAPARPNKARTPRENKGA